MVIDMILLVIGYILVLIYMVNIFECSSKKRMFGIILGWIIIFGSFFTPVVTKEVKYDLVSLSSNSAYNGQFFLGTGRVENELQGTFAYKQDNIIRLKTVPISEGDQFIYTSESPKVIIYIRDKKLWKTTSYCKFYIPEGSIKQNFNILGE